jgi:hypothetical protein
MNMARRKHAKRLAMVMAISLMNMFCAIDRGASRTTVSMDSEYAHAGDKVYGCEGELISDQRHHQVGGKAAVRHENRRGGLFQVDGGAVYGRHDTSVGIEPLREEYVMGTFGALLGWDFKYIGIDGGATILWEQCSEQVQAFPRLNLRLGAIDRVWFESGIGPMDAPFDGRFLYGGVGFRSEWIDFNLGLAAIGRPMVDLEDNHLIFGTLADNGPDLGGYGRLSVHLGRHASFHAGGILSENFSFQLGLSFTL